MAKQEGMFNFQSMMKDFYNYQPGEDDAEGRMMKNAFQGNFLQSGIDAALSQQLSQFNSSLAQANMTHQADLEQRNQSALMKMSSTMECRAWMLSSNTKTTLLTLNMNVT